MEVSLRHNRCKVKWGKADGIYGRDRFCPAAVRAPYRNYLEMYSDRKSDCQCSLKPQNDLPASCPFETANRPNI